jgi:hypothetical protein
VDAEWWIKVAKKVRHFESIGVMSLAGDAMLYTVHYSQYYKNILLEWITFLQITMFFFFSSSR